MKLTYALLRKQRTHNLRYIVRSLLMKLAPGLWTGNRFVMAGIKIYFGRVSGLADNKPITVEKFNTTMILKTKLHDPYT